MLVFVLILICFVVKCVLLVWCHVFLFKFLVSFVLLSASVGFSEDGWFNVEKKPAAAKYSQELDPSIWVLFSKVVGAERVSVRFPEDPKYKYGEDGSLEISSEKDGERFELNMTQLAISGVPADFSEEVGGAEVRHHFVQNGEHLYHLKTVSRSRTSQFSDLFFSSFFIGETR